MNNQNQRGRSPEKREEITDHIRQQIVSGLWHPGDLIPSRAELEKQFKTTPITVQRAVQPLIEDGFLCPKGRKGTFVAENPPHLSRYALVFPHHPEDDSENGLLKRLRMSAIDLKQSEGLDIECFFQMDGNQDRKDHMDLVRQLKRSKFAGIIFASPPLLLQNTAVMDLSGIPRLAFMAGHHNSQVTPIRLAGADVRNRAIDFIHNSAKRSPCFILPQTDYPHDFCTQLIEHVATLGMSLRPEWIQMVNQREPSSCTNIARLLFSANNKIIPDSIFIADDNVISNVIAGLQAELGDRAKEITICVQCNFPSEDRYQLPVKRFGFDIPSLLRRAIDMIAANRSDQQPMKTITGHAGDETECSTFLSESF